MIATIGLVAAAGVGIWLFGGIGLRVVGLIIVFSGILSAAQDEGWGLGVIVAGVILWLAGHWHFAVRHRYWKSPLAQSIVVRVPLLPNPAAGGGVASVDPRLQGVGRSAHRG